jgi:large subunit ribosomal protein L18
MNMAIKHQDRETRRKKRVSTDIHGASDRPRISVHKSNRYFYAQAIDDDAQRTIAAVSSMKADKGGKKPVELSFELGKQFAEKLKALKVDRAVFDRGLRAYKGNVKAFAEGMRENGITI